MIYGLAGQLVFCQEIEPVTPFAFLFSYSIQVVKMVKSPPFEYSKYL